MKALADGGVRYGMGTDTGVPGRFQGYFEHLELQEMVDAGLTPMQAIVAATKSGAEFLKAADLGTLQRGKWADLIVLDKNPLDDIRNTHTHSGRLHRGKSSIHKGTSMTSSGNIAASGKPAAELEGTTHDDQRYVNALGPAGRDRYHDAGYPT